MKSLEKRGHFSFGEGEQFLGLVLSENKNTQVFIKFPGQAGDGVDIVENKAGRRQENMLGGSI